MTAKTKTAGRSQNYLAPPEPVDLNASRLSGLSHASGNSVRLGGTQYPIGSHIGSSGMFVIADPMTDFNPKGPDSIYSSQAGLGSSQQETSSLGSLNLSFMQVRGAYPIRQRGYNFEDWNWTVIRYICLVLVIAVMVILLAATIGLTVSHQIECDIIFNWWDGSSVYRIQVPIFHDSDNTDVGDLAGIARKVGYLTYIGVDMVMLSDFLPAAGSSFNNIRSFQDVDPRVGRMNDVVPMMKALHERDVRAILEFPLATTSNDHVWFLESRKQNAETGNNFKDFYVWETEPVDPFNKGKWQADHIRSQYYYHRNDSTRPVLDWRNPLVYDELEKVLRLWLDRGVDGIMVRDLKDFHVESDAEIHVILDKLHALLDSYGGKKLLGIEGDYFDKVLRRDRQTFESIVSHVDIVEMPLSVSMNMTHKLQWDVEQGLRWQKRPHGPQTLWRLQNYKSIEKGYVAATHMYMGVLPGHPCIQAGDEIGVHYDSIKDKNYKPMLWQSKNIYPYLPGSPLNATTINAMRGVLRARQDSYALRKDTVKDQEDDLEKDINIHFLEVNKETMLVERRFRRQDSFYYGANLARQKKEVDWTTFVAQGEMVADTRGHMSGSVRVGNMNLQPVQSVVFKVLA